MDALLVVRDGYPVKFRTNIFNQGDPATLSVKMDVLSTNKDQKILVKLINANG
jgi:hypothetical protein